MLQLDDRRAARLTTALRRGEVPRDREFDCFLPDDVRAIAWRFWTPLAVVRRAVDWMDELGLDEAIDLGSGVGKFCIAAALMGAGRFTGIEHRPALVGTAGSLARRFSVEDRVSFSVGSLEPARLPSGPLYYLYNPFGENIAPDHEHFDHSVELSEQRFHREVAAVEAFLDQRPAGTYVLIYNGFGGRMPTGYRSIRADYDLPNVLRLWVRSEPRRVIPLWRRGL